MTHASSIGPRASVPEVQARAWPRGGSDAHAGGATRLEFRPRQVARKSYRVLLAHDLTGASEIALVRSARLALEREGHLTILHVVDSDLPARLIAARRALARSHIEDEVRRWLGHSELSYSIDIGIGDPPGAIAARAQAYDADLVVAGRRQRRAFADVLAHGTVECLLRRTRQPTLVVCSSDQSPYRRVLIPVDFTDAAAARVRYAANLLPQASLHLLHAYKRRPRRYALPLRPFPVSFEPNEQQLHQLLVEFIATSGLRGRRPNVTIAAGDAWALLNDELARRKTDLLVLGPIRRSGLERIIIGNAADAALASARCDMLFLPIERESWRGIALEVQISRRRLLP